MTSRDVNKAHSKALVFRPLSQCKRHGCTSLSYVCRFIIIITSSFQVCVICFHKSVVISSDVNKAKRTREQSFSLQILGFRTKTSTFMPRSWPPKVKDRLHKSYLSLSRDQLRRCTKHS